MTRIAAVIAAQDEQETIEELARRLHRVLSGLAGSSWEAIFVIEGRDRTREILERVAAELGGGFCILYQETPSGLGNAFKRGFAAVSPDADLVVTMDADLNHQPEEIPRLIAALESTGSDIVVGSRFVAGSRVEGTPLWKRFLSGTMNFLMRYLYGLRVLDKTSGYRVYRSAALRRIEFTNPAFAFLPEMLIRAHKDGMRIAEEPIRFVFRTEGESKLQIVPTTLSYLALLRTRFDRWSLAVLVLLLLGLAVRIAVTYPTHLYAADADCLLEGLCADKVLHGETPVFFSGFRIGSLECHVTALLFALFGASRESLAVGPILLGVAFMVVAYLLMRLLFGRSRGAIALVLLAVPPPAVLFWTYMPNAYPMVMLLCAAILWLTARLAGSGTRRRSRIEGFLFGLVGGLGIWHSFLTLACLVPAAVWLAWRRRDLLLRWELWGLGLAGFLLGAFPWLAFNWRYGMPSFQSNFASRPATNPAAMLSNAEYFLRTSVPELLASLDPESMVTAAPLLQRLLWVPVLLIYSAAALWFLALPVLDRRRGREPAAPLPAWLLFSGVALTVFLLNAGSAAGEVRGLTVRYILPLFLAAVAAFACFLSAVRRQGRWGTVAAVFLGACVVSFNFAGYRWPGNPRRNHLEEVGREQQAVVRTLEKDRVQVVLGNYWIVYPINFLSRERVLGIPCNPESDLYHYSSKVPSPVGRWGLLGGAEARGELTAWAERAGVPGRVWLLPSGYAVFLPRPGTVLDRDLLARVQVSCGPLGPLGP
jgi:dolichol-phosphate mannosyltransferase